MAVVAAVDYNLRYAGKLPFRLLVIAAIPMTANAVAVAAVAATATVAAVARIVVVYGTHDCPVLKDNRATRNVVAGSGVVVIFVVCVFVAIASIEGDGSFGVGVGSGSDLIYGGGISAGFHVANDCV